MHIGAQLLTLLGTDKYLTFKAKVNKESEEKN